MCVFHGLLGIYLTMPKERQRLKAILCLRSNQTRFRSHYAASASNDLGVDTEVFHPRR
jgi:hypothetical protein